MTRARQSTRSKSKPAPGMFGLSPGTVLAAAVAVIVIVSYVAVSGSGKKAVSLADLKQQTHYHGLAVDPADPSRLMLATHHGFYLVSADGMAARVSPVQDFMGFTPHPADSKVLFASGHPAGGGNLGFIRSDDAGASWKQISPGSGGPVDFHQMDISPADPNVVYGSFRGIQVSRDGGKNWSYSGAAPEGMVALAASPLKADRVYAATKSGLFASDDAGRTWTPSGLEGQAVSMAVRGPGSKMFAFVVGKGLLQSIDGATSDWTLLSNDFGQRALLHMAFDPKDASRLFATTVDNDIVASTDGGKSWHPFGVN